MDNLDDLFERYTVSGTAEEKAELSSMYQDLLNELSYDFSCGKLTNDGGEWMMSIVEKIEILDGHTSWVLRAQTYSVLMYQAEDNGDNLSVISNGQLAIEASLNRLKTEEDKSMVYHGLANVHYTLVGYVLEEQIQHWKKSLHYIKSAIIEQTQEANWTNYLALIYGRLQTETAALSACRKAEEMIFRNWCLGLEEREGSLAFKIASQFVRLKEFLNDAAQDQFSFPENEYLFWLEKSIQDDRPNLTGHELSSIAHFYKKEGVRLQRIDVLKQALRYYKEMAEGFSVYYVTDVLEQMAQVYWKTGDHTTADEYMTEALLWTAEQQELIGSNFSLQLHYAEFLERCYSYEGNISKPDLSYVLEAAQQAETMGEGYYSGPYFIQARLALKENQEYKAATLIAYSLLLHEINIKDLVEEFQNNLPKGKFLYLENFLAGNLQFMEEASLNYYFSPKFTFATLKTMTDDEIMGAWILRKAEIKKRNE